MANSPTTLADLIALVRTFEAERDWEQFHDPKNLAMGLAAEVGELLDHFLWMTPEASRRVMEDAKSAQGIREELADVLGYILYLAHHLGIDLNEALREKMRLNAAKYPVADYRGRFKRQSQ